ncbi:MAG: hypothetical protein KC621_33145 [Myxococcales bacterium]|nr:hypothetical protein [Myxococcales bacterium]
MIAGLLLACGAEPDIALVPPPPAGCEPTETCELAVGVRAGPGFHLNRDYPVRFVADAADRLASDQPEFTFADNRNGTQVVRLAAGTSSVSGKLKVSWCNEEACHIDELAVTLDP